MKSATRITLAAAAFVYATGAALAMGVLVTQSRYECYTKRGYIGLFWCPDVVGKLRWGALASQAAAWPYYVLLKRPYVRQAEAAAPGSGRSTKR
jgi:hypothetical protein